MTCSIVLYEIYYTLYKDLCRMNCDGKLRFQLISQAGPVMSQPPPSIVTQAGQAVSGAPPTSAATSMSQQTQAIITHATYPVQV